MNIFKAFFLIMLTIFIWSIFIDPTQVIENSDELQNKIYSGFFIANRTQTLIQYLKHVQSKKKRYAILIYLDIFSNNITNGTNITLKMSSIYLLPVTIQVFS